MTYGFNSSSSGRLPPKEEVLLVLDVRCTGGAGAGAIARSLFEDGDGGDMTGSIKRWNG